MLADSPWTVPGAGQATCWDGDAGAHRKTRPSMQPSVPLARVWVGGGVFNVGSSGGGHDYCGCHFLEQKGTLD